MAVLILDIESGSIGAALVRSNEFIKTWREHLPLRATRDVGLLAAETEKVIQNLLPAISLEAVHSGEVSNISVFMSPPWGKPNLETGRPDFVPHLQDMLRRESGAYFDLPLNFYTGAGAAAQAMRVISPAEDKYLVCIVTHEMTELLLVYNGAVAGHATIPHGINLPLRTLRTHGGLSDAEARSLLRLGHQGQAAHHLHDTLSSATEHYAQEFKSAARELFDAYAPERVWVISPMGEYFARALSQSNLADLFPQGGTVSALRSHHLEPHHPAAVEHDLFLILEALYVRYNQK
ncbi:MAG: hypothetical protein AAB919_02440 [Patescibacteria group bacterium]